MFPALFRSRITWYIIGGLVLALVLGYLYFQGRHYKLKAQYWEETAQLCEKANEELVNRYFALSNRVEETQKIYEKTLKKYQRLLRECTKRKSKPCKEIVVKGCPTVKIKKQDESDEILNALDNLFKD